jgi:hypothetical protein
MGWGVVFLYDNVFLAFNQKEKPDPVGIRLSEEGEGA